MNYFEFHLGDYAKATGHLTFIEDAAYSRLLRKVYATEKPLPVDITEVQRLIGARSSAERQAVEAVLREFWELRGDGWHNKRCDEEIALYHVKQRKARDSANARWSKSVVDADPLRSHGERSADAVRTHSDGNALQSPNPNLQTPDLRDPDSRSRPVSSAPAQIREVAPERDRTDALAPQVRQVFDHWRSVWGHAGAKLDANRARTIRRALKDYSVDELCESIGGYRRSPHHSGRNDRSTVYDAIDLLLRDADHIDAGIRFAREAPSGLSSLTRRNADSTADWSPPETRNAAS